MTLDVSVDKGFEDFILDQFPALRESPTAHKKALRVMLPVARHVSILLAGFNLHDSSDRKWDEARKNYWILFPDERERIEALLAPKPAPRRRSKR